MPDPDGVAAAVLKNSSWAVLALILEIELFTQEHYKQSIEPEENLSELYKDIFLFHWKEETTHALMDELEWPREDSKLSAEERDRAVGELIAIVADVNGIDTDGVKALINHVAKDPANAITRWHVSTSWKGGTRSDTKVSGYGFGKEHIKKDFTLSIDEPAELGATNQFANPQEYLLAAMNGCIMVGYVVGCSMAAIELEELRIETEGDIDLRGFLGLDPNVKPGYDEISYTVYIKPRNSSRRFTKRFVLRLPIDLT